MLGFIDSSIDLAKMVLNLNHLLEDLRLEQAKLVTLALVNMGVLPDEVPI